MGTFYGDVLTNLFFVFGDVLTNSGTFWLGGVLTRGRFDLHPLILLFQFVFTMYKLIWIKYV